MKYAFRCPSCGMSFVSDHSPKDLKQLKQEGIPCMSCDAQAEYYFDPSGVQVCFTGMAWADKNYKEKKYRNNRSHTMAAKQEANTFKPRLAPNYKGEVAASWKEARDAARSDGKDHASYDRLVKQEESK